MILSFICHQPSAICYLYPKNGKLFLDAPLEPEFNKRGIRFWRDIHHATAGRLEKQVDRAIRYNPTVLLVLSEHSTKSDWVQHEVRTARKLEIETGRDVLCPVSLLFCSTCAKRCRPKKRGDVPFSR